MKKLLLLLLLSVSPLITLANDAPLTLEQVKRDESIKHIDPSAPSLENVRDPYEALEIAKKEGKILIYHFTGSSWCPPCMYLEKKVMHTQELVDFAKDNIVYVNIDFAKGGFTPLDKDYASDYNDLAAKYGITGFPTLILIDPKNNTYNDLVGVITKTPSDLIQLIKDMK